jgi:hypothetical protein
MNLLVAIKSCQKYGARRQSQLDTWLPQLDWAEYRFLIGGPHVPGKEVPDSLMCDCDDSFQNIAPKIVAACGYGLQSNVEAMLVCDDDTYARPDRLLKTYLADIRGKLDCVGFLRTSGVDYNNGIPYPQGSAYWLSKRAMEYVVCSREMKPGVIDDGAVGRALDGKVLLSHDRRYEVGPYVTFETAPHPKNETITAHKALPDVMYQLHRPWVKR